MHASYHVAKPSYEECQVRHKSDPEQSTTNLCAVPHPHPKAVSPVFPLVNLPSSNKQKLNTNFRHAAQIQSFRINQRVAYHHHVVLSQHCVCSQG